GVSTTSLSAENARWMANPLLCFISAVLPLKSAPLPSSVGLVSPACTPHSTASVNRAANPPTSLVFHAMMLSFCLPLRPLGQQGLCPLGMAGTRTRQTSQRAGAATLRVRQLLAGGYRSAGETSRLFRCSLTPTARSLFPWAPPLSRTTPRKGRHPAGPRVNGWACAGQGLAASGATATPGRAEQPPRIPSCHAPAAGTRPRSPGPCARRRSAP